MFDLHIGTAKERITLPVFGRYNIANAVAAAGAAHAMGLDLSRISAGWLVSGRHRCARRFMALEGLLGS